MWYFWAEVVSWELDRTYPQFPPYGKGVHRRSSHTPRTGHSRHCWCGPHSQASQYELVGRPRDWGMRRWKWDMDMNPWHTQDIPENINDEKHTIRRTRVFMIAWSLNTLMKSSTRQTSSNFGGRANICSGEVGLGGLFCGLAIIPEGRKQLYKNQWEIRLVPHFHHITPIEW